MYTAKNDIASPKILKPDFRGGGTLPTGHSASELVEGLEGVGFGFRQPQIFRRSDFGWNDDYPVVKFASFPHSQSALRAIRPTIFRLLTGLCDLIYSGCYAPLLNHTRIG